MILVDTSVWIDLFNHPDSPYAQRLKGLIEKDEGLCICDIILTEILQGIKDDRIFEEVKDSLLKFPIIKAVNVETYILAANIYRLCRKKGKPLGKTIDALIAAVAIENNLALFSRDKDFVRIADCAGLKLL